MATWTAGYVADLDYTPGFYRELTPALLAYVALAQGKRAPNPNGRLAYCELGSGQGVSTNLLAAANPDIDFYATDFIPSHVAESRRLASEAGVSNVQFFEHAFADFADEPSLPMFDIVCLHGIYSWVNAENRAAIVDFLRRKLKPGGLAYVSYNTLGWAPAMPMREMLVRYGESLGGSSAKQLDGAMGFMDKLIAAKARYFTTYPNIQKRFEGLKSLDRNYLAHEYFNQAWALHYHGDVAKQFAEAKLTYLGSTNLLDHIEVINLTEEQRQLLEGIEDSALREDVRDFINGQVFRRDVFVKGSTPYTPIDGQTAWLNQRFALSTAPANISLKIATLQGEATLQPEIYQPVIDALSSGPQTLGKLLSAPAVAGLGAPKVQQALSVLVGTNHVQPCLAAEGDSRRAKTVRTFNAALMHRAQDNNSLVFLASPVTGGGVSANRFEQLFLSARRQKHADPPQFIWNIMASQGQRLLRDGAAVEAPEDNLAQLRADYELFTSKRLPILNQLGID